MAVILTLRLARFLALVFALVLAACSNQTATTVIENTDSTANEHASPPDAASRSEALTHLIQKAAAAYFAGDNQGAIDLAERGLRINRYAPELYLILAQGYDGLGMREQSVSFARLGLRYISAKPEIKPELQALVGTERGLGVSQPE